jgi:hypothetical protein
VKHSTRSATHTKHKYVSLYCLYLHIFFTVVRRQLRVHSALLSPLHSYHSFAPCCSPHYSLAFEGIHQLSFSFLSISYLRLLLLCLLGVSSFSSVDCDSIRLSFLPICPNIREGKIFKNLQRDPSSRHLDLRETLNC